MRIKLTLAIGAFALFAVHGAIAKDALKPGTIFRDCADCPEMVVVPPGTSLMGSTFADDQREGPSPYAQYEKPPHAISIAKKFAVGKFEVTRAQYALFAAETNRAPGEKCVSWNVELGKIQFMEGKSWRDPGFPQEDNHPVVCLNWPDAHDYAAWLAQKTGKPYRMITEAEWEYAARAGSAGIRPWGDSMAETCTYASVSENTRADAHKTLARDDATIFPCKDGYVWTAPVGRFKPNGFGLYDMIGNAWEWLEDCFHPNYVGAPSDGTAWVSDKCEQRVSRSGSWRSVPALVRTARRAWDPIAARTSILGTRVAMTLPE